MRIPLPFLTRLRALAVGGTLLLYAGCPGFGDRIATDALVDGPDGRLDGVDAEGPGPTDAEPNRGDGLPDAADALEVVPRFEPEIVEFLSTHCSLCHGSVTVGGAHYSLVTYEEVVPHLPAVLDRVVTKRDMPPGGGLVTDEERARLTAWARGGAPR